MRAPRILFPVLLVVLVSSLGCTMTRTLNSPNGVVSFKLDQPEEQLMYSVQVHDETLIGESKLGLVVDGLNIGRGVTPKGVSERRINETYPWRGRKNQCRNVCREYTLHYATDGVDWQLVVRMYDDGVAFRYVLPASEDAKRMIAGESTTFLLPADSTLWYQTNLQNYEGVFGSSLAGEMKADSVMTFPVTIEFATGGYGCLTEADVNSYTGAVLKANGESVFRTDYYCDQEGFELEGMIQTPWRVIMLSDSLNGLFACDIVQNCMPGPDKVLFPDGMHTDWVEAGIGRTLWTWWAYDDPGTQWETQKEFVDNAARLGCEFFLVDAGWENPDQGWMENGTSWKKLKELCDYAHKRGVGILVWRPVWNTSKQGPGIVNDADRVAFFKKCAECGVVGVKIDYFDSESHDTVAQYEKILEEAAKHRIVVNFHGANKPTGQMRQWPHELTREGIRGLENNKWSALPRDHYAILPFTRLLVGHGDFTPTTFQAEYLKGTTSALQLASALIYDSPCLTWADKAEVYLNSPAVEMLRRMPTVFDETIVLPGTEIGKVAAFAKLNQGEWFVGILNGGEKADYDLELDFLGSGKWIAQTYSDVAGDPVGIRAEVSTVSAGDVMKVQMETGGGFAGRFSRLVMIPHGGAFDDQMTVSLNCVDPKAKVRYTVDGSAPSSQSALYTGPFAIDSSCDVRAVAIVDGKPVSIEASFTKLQ